jgi:cytochrome c oxidase cbb3-type subunit 2
MSKLNRACAVAVIVWGPLVAAIPGVGAEVNVGGVVGEATRGKQLYRRYCVGCHGQKGDGQGENGVYMEPRPRDFTTGTFKCRSTPTGTLPLDTDVYATIGRGLVASSMPSWNALTAQERADLLAFIKDFSPRWAVEKPEPPLAIPAEPAETPESVTRGGKVYERMECWKCHGKDGSGNGPSATTLTDSKDRPIVPYDFTKGTRFKCGRTNQDLYKIFMTGLDGTPMPSFKDNLPPDVAWDLVHYLRTLQVKVKK